jgi:hypothetical protein
MSVSGSGRDATVSLILEDLANIFSDMTAKFTDSNGKPDCDMAPQDPKKRLDDMARLFALGWIASKQ